MTQRGWASMERKNFFTPARGILLAIGLTGLAGQLFLWHLARQGQRLLWYAPSILCPCVALLSGLFLLYLRIREGTRKGWRRGFASVLVSLLMLAVLTASCIAWIFMQVLGGARQVHASPDGRHRLVTMDSGFMDAVLNAYPMRDRWIYLEQDNGFLSYHEQGAAYGVEIEWREREALVSMTNMGAYANEGSNPGGMIRVTFEE